ncbi:hypothetical protein BBJ28_00021130 [Nothophytophthora sp. Chile5]|nr:hypothetical protein BBJ28_00021130 [Nothophytophthora sp. Chile5]
MGRLQGRVWCDGDAERSSAPDSKHPGHSDPGHVPSRLSLYARLEQRWNDLQVGRQGKYSVERLESLDHYCKTASYTRVVLICVLTPMPALAMTVLLECLPLQPPTEGWMANWVFWIREALTVFVAYTWAISQMRFIIPDLRFTLPQRLTAAAGVATGYIGFCCMMAHIVGFPVPFMWQVGIIPIGLFTPMMLLFVLGRAPFASASPFRPQLQRFNHYFLAHLSVFGVYPVVRFLYDLVPTSYRGLAVLLLPLWKFAAKHFVIRAMDDLEDFMPESVAFIVDFFGSLFLSVCMYNSGSITTSAVIIGSDIAQTLLEFREVHMNASVVLDLLQEQRTHQGHHQRHHSYRQQDTRDLVTLILSICRDPKAFNVEAMKGVRLWACLAHPIPDDRVKALNTLEALATYGSDRPLSGRTLGRVHPNSRRRQLQIQRTHGIVPAAVGPEDRTFASPTTLGPKSLALKHPGNQQDTNMPAEKAAAAERSNNLVVQGLQLLFHCEYLTLVEYVECVVPLVFVVYKSILQQLPNVIYYPGGAGRWGLATVANVLVFATLEVVSFLMLNALLQRKFAFSPLYQLAFVLETQAYLVQATLFSLDHYCETASYTRVVLICVLTPMPALAMTVLLECLPLQPPTEGWMANWVFWVRIAVAVYVGCTIGISQMRFIIPDLRFTLPQRLVVSAGATTGYIGFCCMLSHFIGFPVPFMWQVGVIPIGILTPTMMMLVLGRATFARDSPFRLQFERFHRFFFVHLSIFGIYPVVRVLYYFVPVSYRGIAVLLVPIWKFAAKRFVVSFLRDLEDFMPESVAFVVDFFSSLFLSVCMYNAGSLAISALIIGADIAQSLLEFREVHMNASVVLDLLQERKNDHHQHHSCRQDEQETSNLVTLVLAISRKPTSFNVESIDGVRLWACVAHLIPDERVKALNRLESLGIFGLDHPLSGRTLGRLHLNPPRKQLKMHCTNAIVPAFIGPDNRSIAEPATPLKPKSLKLKSLENQQSATTPTEKKAAAERSKKLVVQGLQLLFHCEYLMLVEYVESFVPLVFVVYKSILQLLPNVAYYPGGAGSWGFATVANILVFATLEIVSFLMLNALLQPLYQLAFVLETQMYLVQATVFMGIVFLLDYELTHLGGGWLHRKGLGSANEVRLLTRPVACARSILQALTSVCSSNGCKLKARRSRKIPNPTHTKNSR